jgi:outer membrane protein TolC
MKLFLKPLLSIAVLGIAYVTSAASIKDTTVVGHHEFTVQQAIDYAEKNNVNVKNTLLGIRLQEETNQQITASAFPHLNASLSTTMNPNVATQVIPNFISPATYQVLIDQGVKDGNGNPIRMPSDFGYIMAQFGTRYTASAGLSLSQLLFDGQVFVGLQARNTSMQFARKNAEVTQEFIKVNIYKIYYQLVVSKTQLELLNTNVKFLEKNLSDTRALYENGFREKLDIDKVSVQLANLETERTKLVNMISNGYYGLKVLMGMPIADELILTDTLSPEMIKSDMLTASSYEYKDRKEYQFAQLGKKMGEYNIRRYRLSQIPTLALNATYAKNAQRNTWNFLNGDQKWFTISNVNLGMTIPLFNGLVLRSKITQSKIELQKTLNDIAALERSIDNEVAVAKNNFSSAVTRMDFQQKNMDLAEKVYAQTKKKYELGTGSQLDINIAQNDLKAAQTNYVSALYDAVVARVDYLKAIGKL